MPLFPLRSGHTDDLGGAEGGEAVHDGDADVDFGGLAVGVSRGDALPKAFRQRILASIRLRACQPVQRFQNALP